MADGMCGTLGALQNQATSLLSVALRKVIQLQRLAQLLTATSVGIPLPNINGLLALSQIGPQTYNQLRAQCPLLGLPPINTASLNQLVGAVAGAYSALQSALMLHPFASLAGLDDQLNKVLSSVEGQLFQLIGPGMSMLSCLQNLCNAGAIVSADAHQAVAAFQSSTTNSNYGTVLTNSMQAQVNQWSAIGSGLNSLMDVPVNPAVTNPPLNTVTTPVSQDPSYAPVEIVNKSVATPEQIATANAEGQKAQAAINAGTGG